MSLVPVFDAADSNILLSAKKFKSAVVSKHIDVMY